jgi:DNA-binding IscR family transcriptional regulator
MLIIGTAFRDSDKSVDLHSLSDELRIPSITIAPILLGLENNGLLTATEKENLVPGREMSRIRLTDILEVVRVDGETGSYRDPKWASAINSLATTIDSAVEATIGDTTLSQLLDEVEQA